jgi:hypothetical protein
LALEILQMLAGGRLAYVIHGRPTADALGVGYVLEKLEVFYVHC